jgi:sec-independent protein translocase protein TatA
VSLGPAEILVIFVVALLVFGPHKLPEIGRQVGKGVRELRKFQTTLRSDLDQVLSDDASDAAAPAPVLPPLPAPSESASEGGSGSAPAPAHDPAPATQPAPPPPPLDTA